MKEQFTLRKPLREKHPAQEQHVTTTDDLLRELINFLPNIHSPYNYVHTTNDTNFDGMTLLQRGGLYVLKGSFDMNTTRQVSIPQFLKFNGLEILKISLLFADTSAKDITINGVPAHPYTGSYIEAYVSLIGATNSSLVKTFGREYEFANLSQIQIITANGTAGQKVYFIITLKSIIPSDTY